MSRMQPLKEKDFFGIMFLPGRVEDTTPERSGTDFEQILLQKIGTVPGLKEQQESFGFSGQGGERKAAQKEYKDRLFKFIFGNPDNKQWTLSLYNAMNGTDYTNPDGIRFNTIGDAVYMGMKNDVSFIICFEMNLWEHQGSFNPNMPMRFFLYAGRLYEKYITTSNYYQYSRSLQPVPRPVCVCFYNGTEEQPEKQVLKLSDAYQGEGDIEVRVTMLNINCGKNQRLMDACEPLKEYAWLVDTVRRHQQEKMDLDAAVDAAISEMPDEYAIKPFLVENRAEGTKILIETRGRPSVHPAFFLDKTVPYGKAEQKGSSSVPGRSSRVWAFADKTATIADIKTRSFPLGVDVGAGSYA